MKILWIMGECPLPANTGGRIGIWQRIVHLSKNNEIYLNVTIDKPEETAAAGEILKYCKKVDFFPRRKKTLLFLAKCLFVPFPAISRWNQDMTENIRDTCRDNQVDYIIVDSPVMIDVLPNEIKKNYKVVLNQHNIDHLAIKSLAASARAPMKKLVYYYVAAQMKRYEEKMYSSDFVDLYTFVSSKDMEYFARTYQKRNLYLLPVGANIDEMPVENNSNNIMFIGKMSYPPNIEGVRWFVNNCWDWIRQSVPDAQLYIVGKEPDAEIIKACAERPGVHVTGTVPSVKEYYRKASLIIIPLFNGGGVKVKLLEALGYGKLVVSTSKGVEGTDFKHNEHLIVEEEKRKFAEYCIDILKTPEKYESMRKAALDKMRKQYSWDELMRNFENYLREGLIR